MEIAHLETMNWVYDFSDYQQMYDLTAQDLSKPILDFHSGISSFNATATQQGAHVVSADPAYALSCSDMPRYAERVLSNNITRLLAAPERLKNSEKNNIDHVTAAWRQTEKTFLQDYDKGLSEKRYQAATVPALPYKTHQFDLALCTDFIFYQPAEMQTVTARVKELTRVAFEVRIFPLMDECGKISDELGPLMLYLQRNHFGVEVREVPYKTLHGNNAMLRIWSQTCDV